MPVLPVVVNTSHVIELTDGTHYATRFVLLHGCQAEALSVLVDLFTGVLKQPVPSEGRNSGQNATRHHSAPPPKGEKAQNQFITTRSMKLKQ